MHIFSIRRAVRETCDGFGRNREKHAEMIMVLTSIRKFDKLEIFMNRADRSPEEIQIHITNCKAELHFVRSFASTVTKL